MLTPLVIAMPEPMAEALGYPERARSAGPTCSSSPASKTGWADFGHPEWGPFRLGKTNPNFSTSGLSALIAQTYAATRHDRGPHLRGPRQPGRHRLRHRRRVRRRALRRHHAHVPQQPVPRRPAGHVAHLRLGRRRRGEVGPRLQRRQPRRRSSSRARRPVRPASRWSPSIRRRARSSATTRSSCSRPTGSTPSEAEGARRFADFVEPTREPGAGAGVRLPAGQPRGRGRRARRRRQRRRPRSADDAPRGARARRHDRAARPVGGPAQAGAGAARHRRVGVDGRARRRRATRAARPGSTSPRRRRISAIDLFARRRRDRPARLHDRHRRQTGDEPRTTFLDLVDYGRVADVGEEVRSAHRRAHPAQRHAALRRDRRPATTRALEGFDPTRINAVVLLTDGVNDDGDLDDDERPARRAAGDAAGRAPRARHSQPVRVFTIAYSERRRRRCPRVASPRRAPPPRTRRPTRRRSTQVLTAVVSNF